jgi:hypothetical protein
VPFYVKVTVCDVLLVAVTVIVLKPPDVTDD